MTRLVFALGLLTVSLCVAPPARADFAVVHFNSGFCRIWVDTAAGPQDGQFWCSECTTVSSIVSIRVSRRRERYSGRSRGMSAEQTDSESWLLSNFRGRVKRGSHAHRF